MNFEARADNEIEIDLLLEAIFLRFQYDFRQYSKSSIRRRISQAMNVFQCASVSALQARLFDEPSFFSHLLNFLTVPTSEMFRDPDYFLSIRKNAIPYLKTFPSLKLWVAGCSTGEEVYTFAIILREEQLLEKTIIYATDINPHSLEKAQRGIYDVEAIRQASANYLKSGGHGTLSDHFQAAYGAVQFDRSLTENVVFTDHSLSTDSVFAETHLVSCRNVLIYFERELQDRAVGLFQGSLVYNGFLGLGSKESLHFSKYRDAFYPIDKAQRLFQKL